MAHLTKQLADSVVQIGVHTAYGEPIDIDGTTVMPVAVTGYGFGAGEGTIGDEQGGEGGGGGASIPVGAYVSRGGDLRFEPNLITLLAVGIPFVCVAGRALARVIKALKK